MKRKINIRLWTARLLIAMVIAWNLQAALLFFLNPQAFSPGFELGGVAGSAAMRGFAVLFVMWNIPYLVALWEPHRNRVSLLEALVMQTLGVMGESIILITLPVGHAVLHSSLLRFIAFDSAGLVALGFAAFLVGKRSPSVP
jgi:hypothetical protein